MTCKTGRRAGWTTLFTLLVMIRLAGYHLLLAETGVPVSLQKGWKLQSGCVVKETGEQLSLPGYRVDGWLDAIVPGTVLGSQVADGIFPDPFFGMNLRKIPGTDYPIGKIFGYFPMSESSPYRCAWWYRTEFAARSEAEKAAWLHFDGINYRANIWLNGKQVASSDDVAGAFRAYDFDVSKYLVHGGKNVLAIEVFAQTENDLGIDFLDWNPAPADKSMGLWRGVSLESVGPVMVRSPAVSTHFTKDDLSEADLRLVMDVVNGTDRPVSAKVEATIGRIQVQQQVELAAFEKKVVHFDAADFPELRIENPAVWWPYQYGDSHLERMRVSIHANGIESDAKTVRFGIREVDGALNDKGYLQFRVNRRNILVRGGGWNPDLFYREPRERLREELDYVKHMNLNTIRLEGKLGSEEMFDLADEMGILVMAGWQCCDAWQKWDEWTTKDRVIANASLYSQISRLRSHPSLLTWMNGSDEVPVPEIEKAFLGILSERDWPNAVMSTAADRKSAITGRSGVKMSGPYDYVPPEYWYLDKEKLGGAFGFNTETGPGPAIPSVDSIQRTLPKESWWPIDQQWNYHAGLGKFAQYDNFNRAMAATYGQAAGLQDYSLKAQLMAYDGERAMFEAYGANKYTSTGVIQWMLNNAWPSFIWHLYDYYLVPGGGYFGTRKANEPLHIQYRYDDRSVAVVNSTLVPQQSLHAKVRIFDLDGTERFTRESTLNVAADGVTRVLTIPFQSTTVFLKLELHTVEGTVLSNNFYWLPAKLAQLDWDKSTYVNTPALSYADMKDLTGLEKASLNLAVIPTKEQGKLVVRLKNEGRAVAFFVHLRAVKAGTDEEIVPVFWSDNFVSLIPGETCELSAAGIKNAGPNIEIKADGWNLAPIVVKLHQSSEGTRHPLK